MAISPDGGRIASGSENGPVQLWDARGGKLLRTMPGHRGRVRAVLFSRDGRRVISGGQDDTVRFWNADSGRPEGDPRDAHQQAVASAALSRDGHLLATGGNDGSIQLWDANIGKPSGARITPGHLDGDVWNVAFSPDGRHVVVANDSGGMELWDVDSRRQDVTAFGDRPPDANSVAYSPDGRLIASGGNDGVVRLWDSNSHKPTSEPMDPYQGMLTDKVSPGIVSLTFTPDGAYLVSGGFDKMLRVWRVDDGRPVGDPITADSEKGLHAVAVFPDGRSAASGGTDGLIRQWPLRSPDLLCAKLATSMSQDQWRDWVSPDVPYHVTCSDLPRSD
jgi:WD40 repeat protein